MYISKTMYLHNTAYATATSIQSQRQMHMKTEDCERGPVHKIIVQTLQKVGRDSDLTVYL